MIQIHGPVPFFLASIFISRGTTLPVVQPVSDLSPKHLVQCGTSFYNTTTSSCLNNKIVCPFVGGQVVNATMPQPCDQACNATVPAHYFCEDGMLQESYLDATEGSPVRHLPNHPGDYQRTAEAAPPAPTTPVNQLGKVERGIVANGTITNETEASQVHHLPNHPGDYRRPSEPQPSASAKPVVLINPKDPPNVRRAAGSNGDSTTGKSGSTTVITVDDNGAVTQQAPPRARSIQAKRDDMTNEVNAAVNKVKKSVTANEDSGNEQPEQQGSPTDMFPSPKFLFKMTKRSNKTTSDDESIANEDSPLPTTIPRNVPRAAQTQPKPKNMTQNFINVLIEGGEETQKAENKTMSQPVESPQTPVALPRSSAPASSPSSAPAPPASSVPVPPSSAVPVPPHSSAPVAPPSSVPVPSSSSVSEPSPSPISPQNQPTPLTDIPLVNPSITPRSMQAKRDNMTDNFVNTLVDGAKNSMGASSYASGESMQQGEAISPPISGSNKSKRLFTNSASADEESIVNLDKPLPVSPPRRSGTPMEKRKRDTLSSYPDQAGTLLHYLAHGHWGAVETN